METEGTTTGAKARGLNSLNLAPLKSREEGGTKKEYEDFLEKLDNHVSVNWDFGGDVAYVIKNNKEPVFEEPVDLSEENEKVKWKVMLWKQQVNRYGHRVTALVHNLEALYSMIFENVVGPHVFIYCFKNSSIECWYNWACLLGNQCLSNTPHECRQHRGDVRTPSQHKCKKCF